MANIACNFNVPRYDQFNMPNGWLVDKPACHALFYYACLAAKHVQNVADNITYEGEISAEGRGFDARSVMKSVALMYGVQPEEMIRFWSNVDFQFDTLGSRRLPTKFRMAAVPELHTKGWGNLA